MRTEIRYAFRLLMAHTKHELELELIQTQMAQKPVLREEVHEHLSS
jgi:hypothetical protein